MAAEIGGHAVRANRLTPLARGRFLPLLNGLRGEIAREWLAGRLLPQAILQQSQRRKLYWCPKDRDSSRDPCRHPASGLL